MKEIRVYHSLTRSAFLVAICFGFVTMCIQSLATEKLMAWLGIVIFGFAGLFMLWLMLKERMMHAPYYVITADSITMNSGFKSWTVRFAMSKCLIRRRAFLPMV